eukprot:g43560.t1
MHLIRVVLQSEAVLCDDMERRGFTGETCYGKWRRSVTTHGHVHVPGAAGYTSVSQGDMTRGAGVDLSLAAPDGIFQYGPILTLYRCKQFMSRSHSYVHSFLFKSCHGRNEVAVGKSPLAIESIREEQGCYFQNSLEPTAPKVFKSVIPVEFLKFRCSLSMNTLWNELGKEFSKRFRTIRCFWNAVALWAWDIVVDNCAICRNHIMDL